jgi:hypothetical protein
LLALTAISGEFPADQLKRLRGSDYYKESIITSLKKDGLLRTYYRDKLRGYRLGAKAKVTLLSECPGQFVFYLTGDTDTNYLKSEMSRRLRLHRIAQAYVTMENAGAAIFREEKPDVFAPEGSPVSEIESPVFFNSREIKEVGIDFTKIRASRSVGVLFAPSGIFVTYNCGAGLMKWKYKSELRMKTLMWTVLCQQRLSAQFRPEDVSGLVLGDGMEPAYQMLTSNGGKKHDCFMLDGCYEHFFYVSNDRQGETLLCLLCDADKKAELDRILSLDLSEPRVNWRIENDAIDQNGEPVLFGYSCDMPRIVRFNTALELQCKSGTLICFDYQREVLERYCGSRVRFQTIAFEKFERRFFP